MKRRGKRGRSAAGRRFKNLLLVCAAYAALFLIMTSPLFDLRLVEIQGNHQISRTEILHLSGINFRNNIFSLPLRDIAFRIKSHPRVKTVKVWRRLPSMLVIKVEERRPVALLLKEDVFYQIDAEGYAVGKGVLQDAEHFPLIDLPNLKRIAIGYRIKAKHLDSMLYTLVAAYSYLVDMPRKIDVDKKGYLCLYIKEGRILLGNFDSQEVMNRRLRLASEIHKSVKEQGRSVEYIDVRFGNNPVVKYGD